MASRRNRTGSRWTPTKPAPETSVAIPPDAGGAPPGSAEPQSPIVDDFIRHEAAAGPTPVEAALVEAAPSPPATDASAERAGPAASAAPAEPPPEPDEPEPAPPAEAAPIPVTPVHVGFPRRGETVRAASTPLSEINATLATFVRSEGQAALAHLDALSKAASPADAMRLQFGEIQRAADASLSCFGSLLRTANRFGFPPPRS